MDQAVITNEALERRKQLRVIARRRVSERDAEIRKVTAAGGNIFHRCNDLDDEDKEFALTIPEEDREIFWAVFAEELIASANQMNVHAAELNAKAANDASGWALTLAIAVIAMCVVGVAIFFGN